VIPPYDPYHGPHLPHGNRKDPSHVPMPWLLLAEQEIAAWYLRHPEATCSNRVARCLAWLEEEFAA